MYVFSIGMMVGAVIGMMIARVYYRRLWEREVARMRELVSVMSRIVSSADADCDRVLNLEEDDQEQQGVSSR